jgi:predicted N-formylglutamate amidohydrolase
MHRNDHRAVVITCEHATYFVPKPFKGLFRGHEEVLQSHRGWDPGTLALGKAIAKRFGFPLFATEVSRLLIEVNRSPWHGHLFSEFSRGLEGETKQNLQDRYYHPYRNAVENWIALQSDAASCVVHLSLHSFTPVFNGVERNAEVGLLYDPRRQGERELCDRWKQMFRRVIPNWRVRKNYPYLGRSDGFTTHLRKRFNDEQYRGIELEINQREVIDFPKKFEDRIREIVLTIGQLLEL